MNYLPGFIDFYTLYDFCLTLFQNFGFGDNAEWLSYLTAGVIISFLSLIHISEPTRPY